MKFLLLGFLLILAIFALLFDDVNGMTTKEMARKRTTTLTTKVPMSEIERSNTEEEEERMFKVSDCYNECHNHRHGFGKDAKKNGVRASENECEVPCLLMHGKGWDKQQYNNAKARAFNHGTETSRIKHGITTKKY